MAIFICHTRTINPDISKFTSKPTSVQLKFITVGYFHWTEQNSTISIFRSLQKYIKTLDVRGCTTLFASQIKIIPSSTKLDFLFISGHVLVVDIPLTMRFINSDLYWFHVSVVNKLSLASSGFMYSRCYK